MKIRLFWAVSVLALLLSACGGGVRPEDSRTETEGRLLLSTGGAALLITGDGTPIALSVQSEGDDPFAGFSSGDRVAITHDSAMDDTYPLRTGAYEWRLLEKGTMEDLPEETLTDLEALGWDFGRDVHAPAEEARTVEDPVSGYCGNTVTEVILDGKAYSFWGDDSVVLTDLVINLDYTGDICRCLPEFSVNTEFGDGYGVNLTEHYVRHGEHQCPITEEQAEKIRGILDRNCTEENLVGDD